jgi:hypothetical protein
VISELCIEKNFEGAISHLTLMLYTGIRLQELRKATKNLSQPDSGPRFEPGIPNWKQECQLLDHDAGAPASGIFECNEKL